jgi:hypothetical protein
MKYYLRSTATNISAWREFSFGEYSWAGSHDIMCNVEFTVDFTKIYVFTKGMKRKDVKDIIYSELERQERLKKLEDV